MLSGTVFDIKRFAVHDGDGIRTTVFLKGCPLACRWCHNPEGLSKAPQLAFFADKCSGCGRCARVCKAGAHTVGAAHTLDRTRCDACGACAAACPQKALRLYGKTMTVDALLPLLLEDRAFYDNSGGGITLSGGECLLQADFCAALLKACKAAGLRTAVDTCGDVPRAAFDKVLPYTDRFLYDLKAIDENVHIAATGRSNRRILENLRYIDACGKAFEIRYPFVPDYNADQAEKIAAFVKTLSHCVGVKVLPYHNLAGSKYAALGMKNTLPAALPTAAEVAAAQKLFE